MQFKQGTKVVTSDGQNSGTVDRVVLDPRTKQVTDVVLRKGFILPEDKVVPIQHVVEANDQHVVLKDSAERVRDLPPFEEKYYVPSNDEIGIDYTTGYARPLYGYPPIGPLWPNSAALAGKIETQQNIPPNTVAVKEGAKVTSQDGKHAGNVERVILDSPSNRITHIVVSHGLMRTRKLVPASWIQEISEDGVTLAVGQPVLDELAAYQD
ncbi:MAG TPA: PRC-barrel domain-containing protein [Aggregatilineales bacterium]|nr:PRC-barrel domain-containing protein [Aggregatilineales bacterium]